MGKLLTIIGSTFLIFSSGANAEVATGTSQANILTIMSATNTDSMNFGVILPSGADEIVMRPQEDSYFISSTSGLSLLSETSHPSRFELTGEASAMITVQTDSSVTLSGPGTDMIVDDLFTQNYTPTFDTEGTMRVRVGGTLNINESQAPGDYSGTFQVTFTYQ